MRMISFNRKEKTGNEEKENEGTKMKERDLRPPVSSTTWAHCSVGILGSPIVEIQTDYFGGAGELPIECESTTKNAN